MREGVLIAATSAATRHDGAAATAQGVKHRAGLHSRARSCEGGHRRTVEYRSRHYGISTTCSACQLRPSQTQDIPGTPDLSSAHSRRGDYLLRSKYGALGQCVIVASCQRVALPHNAVDSRLTGRPDCVRKRTCVWTHETTTLSNSHLTVHVYLVWPVSQNTS